MFVFNKSLAVTFTSTLLSVWLDISLIIMLLPGASFLNALWHDLHPQFVQFSLFVLQKINQFLINNMYIKFHEF